ncbi:crotonase/enoyl-CoA hydratase family protein [Mycolicibacterium sp. 120266]|uniref:crotonase/enoyl-CoA hydratase family protein n=1 Tax=Mycolicibacterium sp. 120266 TaxID=3090601 RepID=UPI00299D4BAD|nr:crotonase/enoyl-CoA hydratase family protein [Mycolicibacterium sp. 120266]MDX1876175.1 crotonase/enoyl-CoA hydratase family protein [Mycolicibacterium sp. 120266]
MTHVNQRISASLHFDRCGSIGVLRLDRAHKRNALDDVTIEALGNFFTSPPSGVSAVVLTAAGEHFCAGLDLSQLAERDAMEGVMHSRMWHAALGAMADGAVPVVAVLKGAVVGGGLELASAAHIRIAERSAFFALPEGQRGLFVGGGASMRIPRLIGVARMQDMMLTGRVLDAEAGERHGLATYLVGNDEGEALAFELANTIAANSPVTNYAVLQALPRIAEVGRDEGLMMESLMAGIAQSTQEAKDSMAAFLAGTGNKVSARRSPHATEAN